MTLPVGTATLWMLLLLAILGGVQIGLAADDPSDVPELAGGVQDNVSEHLNESQQNATSTRGEFAIEQSRGSLQLLLGPMELVGLGVAGVAEVLEGHARAIADLLALAGGGSAVWIVREVLGP